MDTQLNAYKITWIFLTPVKGGAVQADLKKISKIGFVGGYSKGCFTRHCPTVAFAKDILKKVPKLSRQYKAILITDKQFGMMKFGSDVYSVATKKQLAEMTVVG